MKVYSEVWTQATFILSFPSADNTNDSVARSWLIIKSERLIHFIPSLSMFIFQPRIRCPNLDLVEGLYSLFVAVGWETSFKIADCLIVIYKLEVFWSCKDSGPPDLRTWSPLHPDQRFLLLSDCPVGTWKIRPQVNVCRISSINGRMCHPLQKVHPTTWSIQPVQRSDPPVKWPSPVVIVILTSKGGNQMTSLYCDKLLRHVSTVSVWLRGASLLSDWNTSRSNWSELLPQVEQSEPSTAFHQNEMMHWRPKRNLHLSPRAAWCSTIGTESTWQLLNLRLDRVSFLASWHEDLVYYWIKFDSRNNIYHIVGLVQTFAFLRMDHWKEEELMVNQKKV